MYYLVNNNNKLNFLINKILTNNTWIAIDTEFHTKKKCLYPFISIIQLCFPNGKSYAVDCIDNNFKCSLKGFIQIIQNSKATKVFFSGMQDLIIFNKLTNSFTNNVFDIQIAAKILGYRENIGLGELYENIFNTKISKQMQRSNWLQRPLTKEQIIYSFLDIYYIQKVYKVIYKQLLAQNLLKEAEDTINKSYSEDSFKYNIKKEIRKLKIKSSISEQLAYKIFELREQIANDYNISRKLILSNRDIAYLAHKKPCNSKEILKNINPSKQIKNHQEKLLAILKEYCNN